MGKKRPDANARSIKAAKREAQQESLAQKVQDSWLQLPPKKRKGGRDTWLEFIAENTTDDDTEARDELIGWEDWQPD